MRENSTSCSSRCFAFRSRATAASSRSASTEPGGQGAYHPAIWGIGRQSRLLERDEDLKVVRRALGSACEEAGGGTLLIEGPAGVGKTALLGALATTATADGYEVLRARGSEMERDFGFGLARQLFGPLLRSLGPAGRAKLFAGPAGLAAAIFGLAGEGLEVGAAESSLYGLFWMLAGLAERGPVVLVIDDAHWSDSASLRFVRYLGRRLDGLPILVALAARPGEPGVEARLLDELTTELAVPQLTPAPLSESGTATLVRERLGAAATGAVATACHEATGGNPFLIEELLTELATEGDGASAAAVAAMGPERIGAAVDARARRFDPLGAELMRAAAVLGDAADLRALATLVDADRDRVAAIVDGLTAASILAPGPTNSFVHPLVRAAVYEGIPAARRDGLHARAASVLAAQGAGAEEVAAHLLRCAPGAVTAAPALLDAAAAEASERGAPDSAAAYLRRALEEGPTASRRADLLRRLGSAEVVARDPAAIPHLQEAAAITEDRAQALSIYLELGDLLSLAGQWEAAVQNIDAGLTRFDDPEVPGFLDLEAYRAAYRGYDPAAVADFDRDLPRLRALVAAHRPEESLRLRWVLAALSSIRDGSRAEVEALVGPAEQDWSLRRDGRETSAVAQAGCALLVVDAFDGIDPIARALTEEGRRRGSLLAMIAGVGFAAGRASRMGDLRAAETDFGLVIEQAEQNELSLMALTTMIHFCTDALVERRALANTAGVVERLELPPPFDQTQSGGMALEARAAIRATRGDRAGAIADLRATAAIFGPLQAGPRFTRWRSSLALALPDSDREEALSLATEELAMARAVAAPRAEGAALRALGQLTGGEAGIERLRESVAILRDSPTQLEWARSLAELGAALRRANRRGEARDRLRQAADLAQRCGAERLEERVYEEMRIAGARPRRRALSGAASLTPGERRVANAAAGGATNREIAQDLFVSLRTVEMHLTNAYRKLDIASRSELPGAINAGSLGDSGI
ncbi:MAG: AAA family ATPase [Actinobacteria bacterium]|nr:AAA family ATPase [Actinomycetota bacterium]